MGRNNQQRRTAKKRKGGSGQRRHDPGGSAPLGWQPADDPEWLLAGAGHSAADGDGERLEAAVEHLARLPVRRVEEAAVVVTAEMLAAVFEGGWQPAEAVRAVRRDRSSVHAELVTTAMVVDRWRLPGTTAPAGWTSQLVDLGVERWWGNGDPWLHMWARRAGVTWPAALRTAAETLGVLMALPTLQRVLVPPSVWGASPAGPAGAVADGVMAKIRALLAKAESTAFEAEAEALTAKAQELMARHAVDEAVARADGGRSEAPTMRRIPVDDPYAAAKGQLLNAVAGANGVRTVSYRPLGLVALVGFASDIDAVEVLFTSLLVQATRALVERGRVTDGRGRSRTRSYRQSFLLAYASRVRERLHAAASVAHSEAETALGRSLLPVLAGRDHEVEEALARRFPSLHYHNGPRATNMDGWRHGRVAAELANLGEERGMLSNAG